MLIRSYLVAVVRPDISRRVKWNCYNSCGRDYLFFFFFFFPLIKCSREQKIARIISISPKGRARERERERELNKLSFEGARARSSRHIPEIAIMPRRRADLHILLSYILHYSKLYNPGN